jgi:ATP-binding cassette, subfamily B, bacterial
MLKLIRQRTLNIARALGLVWRSGRGWTMVSLGLIIAQGILPLLTLYLTKLIVDAVAGGMSATDKESAFGRVALLIGLAGSVAIVSALCRSVEVLVRQAQEQSFSDYLHEVLQAKSLAVDLAYYENSQYYDTLHRAQQEGFFRPIRILNSLLQMGQSGISLVAVACLLFTLHWGIATILFAAVVPGTFVRLKYANRMYHWQRQRTGTERRANYFNWMLTQDWHAKEVRLFDLGPLFIRRFRDLSRQLRREKLTIAAHRASAEFVAQGGATLAVFSLYTFIAYATIRGAITLGGLVMYFQAFQRGQDFLRDFLTGVSNLYEDSLFLANLYQFLDLKTKIVAPARPKPFPRPMKTGIVFDHVSFQYHDGKATVLDDVNLTIRRGTQIALVGENGAGKSTLIKLLCRLYDPIEGRITIDGLDLRQFDPIALRRELSVIFQDFAKYYLTARENIWFGNPSLAREDERIITAARRATADEVINRLSNGYETVLGNWFEDGEELSIGQWQKVALARAFLREAQIIVLDEPTSALDARAEYEIFKQFHRLAAGQTAILISHRLSTVRQADYIYVLDAGRIVESGTHNELVSCKGKYAGLFETQAQYYR